MLTGEHAELKAAYFCDAYGALSGHWPETRFAATNASRTTGPYEPSFVLKSDHRAARSASCLADGTPPGMDARSAGEEAVGAAGPVVDRCAAGRHCGSVAGMAGESERAS